MFPLLAAPPEVRWNYTYACNFTCSHCYTRAAWYPTELTSAQYAQIADQLVEAGVFVVGFGGGEVLLRRDCLDTVARLSRSGIRTVLTSNGWLLDDRRAAQLANAGLGILKMSLDSPNPAQHNAVRNRPGSFERVMRALEAGVRAGLTVYLSSVLTAVNQDALEEFVAIAQRGGLTGISFARFRPAGNGLQTKAQYHLTEAALRQAQEQVTALRQRTGLDLVLTSSEETGSAAERCGCGVRHLTIRPNGDVSPCNFAEAVIGNLTRDTLVNLWRRSPALAAWRARGGCSPDADQPAPANPGAPPPPVRHPVPRRSSTALRLWGRSSLKQAELLDKRQQVDHAASFSEAAVGDVRQHRAAIFDRRAGRRDTPEGAGVGTAGGIQPRDAVVAGDHVFESDLQVRERRPQLADALSHARRSRWLGGLAEVDEVRCEQLIDDGELAPIEHGVDPAADERLLLRGHTPSPSSGAGDAGRRHAFRPESMTGVGRAAGTRSIASRPVSGFTRQA
jgi:MoaA/NifB/PqqE/SkfB family radical SAM enzyme